MNLTRQIRVQLLIFGAVALTVVGIVVVNYLQAPRLLLGIGRYTVAVEMAETGGLYRGGNVTYRGVNVGRVHDVRLTGDGAEAVLRLDSKIAIPATDLVAEVHSMSGVGEQYVALTPSTEGGPVLKNGDVIPRDRTFLPPDFNTLLAATNRGLAAIPRDDLKTVVDESYTAVGGLGPELARLVKGVTRLSIDARTNLESLITLIDDSGPILDSQIRSADSIARWTANSSDVTGQLRDNDVSLRGILQEGPAALQETQRLLERLEPTLPVVLANLVSIGDVAVTYRDNLEGILVLVPQITAMAQGALLAQKGTKQAYRGIYLDFNLNMNLPPNCTTGFLPAQQQRSPLFEDYPDRPPGNLYCRVPQDSTLTGVRGARNYPCVTRPGKRAPTVKMCESDEPYIPLNDGFNWKGDPNATWTGQEVPQLDPDEGAPPPEASPEDDGALPAADTVPMAVSGYDPDTGRYVGPDGNVYAQSNLIRGAGEEWTWQQMLIPPSGN
ncbi:MlaD family protein [Mycobacterium sp. 1274756.6]|uniref:MCE family protein n=1 Tax=Mycobacterium sp. 1274756.6 TaxID=1834076 RepID=UPI0008002E25|nr:MlaD family protein [Mycobacterium sp. 1274756.6]OBJ67827.1 mammalian cell entry protein [Mycobacterium sp. 1274756.6]